MHKEIDYNNYCSKLPIAEEIYKQLSGENKERKTAQEIADKYNKVGLIIRIILKGKV